jgi:hypothetical protein
MMVIFSYLLICETLAAIQQGHVHHVAKPKAAHDPQSLDRLIEKKTRHRAAPRELKARLMSGQLPAE